MSLQTVKPPVVLRLLKSEENELLVALKFPAVALHLAGIRNVVLAPARISVFVSHRSAITDQQSPISNHRSATRDTTGYEQGIVIRSMNRVTIRISRHGEASVNVILDPPVVFAPVVLNVIVPATVWPPIEVAPFLLLAHFVGRRRGALITNTVRRHFVDGFDR